MPPNAPNSIAFLALSHAAPPVFIKNANNVPVTVALISKAPTAPGPRVNPITIGNIIGSIPGIIISLSAAIVLISTHFE